MYDPQVSRTVAFFMSRIPKADFDQAGKNATDPIPRRSYVLRHTTLVEVVMFDHLAVFGFMAVGALSLFSFLAVASWADARRKEREAYYKSETLKKIAESQGAGATAALELMREEERTAARQLRDGQRLGGLITLAVGIALMIFLRAIPDANDKQVFYVGLIPALIGVALLVHSYWLAPKE
jgi:hypothetical protein